MNQTKTKQLISRINEVIRELELIKGVLESSLKKEISIGTISEASKMYNIPNSTIRGWIRKGRIGYTKDSITGKFVVNLEDIENYINKKAYI